MKSNHTRQRLVKSNPGMPMANWLFIPGGPGADSMYFLDLIEQLEMPGKYWLIDFPANGDNLSEAMPAEYDFDSWSECLLATVDKFEQAVLVGHSFGGMLPLLFPQLEDMLVGFVMLNAGTVTVARRIRCICKK